MILNKYTITYGKLDTVEVKQIKTKAEKVENFIFV